MIRPQLQRLGLATAAILIATAASAGQAAAFEPQSYEIEAVESSLSTTQAGAHADLTVGFKLSHNASEEPYAATRDVLVAVPPGVFGNPQAVPRCTTLQFGTKPEQSECPQDSQVGIAEVTLGGFISGNFDEPLYNLTRGGEDVVARLGFFAGSFPVIVDVEVDPHDYGLIATSENASSSAGLIAVSTTLWGVPADPSHDDLRITPEEAINGEFPPGGRKSGLPEAPFMTNPTDCSTPREVTVTATSYQEPQAPRTKSGPFPQITGCGKIDFAPEFTLTPTNPEAAAPTGLDAVLKIPQDETPGGRATSTLRAAIVALPEGMTINPAAANGLEACSAEQVRFEENVAAECPNAASLGSAEITVPALEHPLHGAVYQRSPGPNQGELFRFWLVADELGVHLKLPAEIEADEQTGQLTTLFLGIPSLGGNPQVPVSELKLHIREGARAPLATPSTCGTYETEYGFIPWSGNGFVFGETPMQITSGCGKGGFNPGLEAGMLSLRAGAFSPFVFQLTRSDGEANPQSLEVTLPKGLLAKLGGVPVCGEPEAAAGNCPEASKIGSVTTAVGVGNLPLWIPQPGKAPTAAYLAGPYKGAPYSAVIVVPAQAGPFDLGTVVTRAGIYVDPETAIATIKSDPLPQILKGVPVAYRAIRVITDRPEFTLNPTNCAEEQIKAHVVAANGASADPSTPFQATNCAKLAYSPKLSLRLRGQMKRSGDPSLRAILTQPPHQANTARASVVLPASEYIDQAHINNPCTRVQFAAHECPPSSILGKAKAYSPLLDKPLEGPVYFRSNPSRELPDVVADLNGQIHVTLVGNVDSVLKRGTEISRVRTTFASVPDAPVTKFVMSLYGGRRGLIENSVNLCEGQQKRRASVKMWGQNGRRHDFRAAVGTSCR